MTSFLFDEAVQSVLYYVQTVTISDALKRSGAYQANRFGGTDVRIPEDDRHPCVDTMERFQIVHTVGVGCRTGNQNAIDRLAGQHRTSLSKTRDERDTEIGKLI